MATLRKLGALETMIDMVMPELDDIYVQIFVVRSSTGSAMLSSRVAEAVQVWAMRHPLLRARIEVRPDGRYFVQMKSDGVRGAVHAHEELREWTQLAEDEMERPIDTVDGPLWRINVGRMSEDKHVVMWTVHHAIVDAVNFMAVGIELLSILNGQADSLPRIEGVALTTEQLLYGADTCDGPPPEYDESTWLTPENKLPTSFGSPSDSKCRFRLFPFQLEAAVSDRLLQASKQHGVKMNSTLSCIAAMAHAMLYQANNEHIGSTVQVRTAVNTRPYLNIPSLHLGCYMTTLVYRAILAPSLDESLSAFWSIAKDMNDDLHSRVANDAIQACKMDSIYLNDVLNGIPITDSAHFFFSNLGALSSPPRDTTSEVSLEEAYFISSIMSDSWLVPVFHAVMTLNGRLFWSIGYHEKVFRTDLALQCQKLIMTVIDQLS